MHHFDKAAFVDEELHDLKMRFELLEGDRKAYYETSQWAMRQNKEEIGSSRNRNKELREEIAQLKKFDTELQAHKNRSALSGIEKLDQRICELHKKYDDTIAQARTKEARIQEMEEQLMLMHREIEMAKQSEDESEDIHAIRVLENRLDKGLIKFHEAQSLRKIYEQIVKKLQEERLTFDNQLLSFEKALKAKKEDVKQLEMMSRDANHAKEVAKTELTKIETQLTEERRQRERDIAQRKELIKQKRQLDEKTEKKLMMDDQIPLEANRKVEYDEEKEKKILEFEETLRIIKEATGVSNLDEVVEKFKAQQHTQKHLLELQKQKEARFEELKVKKVEALAQLDELKLSIENKHAHSRRVVDEFQQHLTNAKDKYQQAKSRCERANKTLTNVKSGVQHLAEKLECIVTTEKLQKPSMNDENLIQVMGYCAAKLSALYENIQSKDFNEADFPLSPATITQAVLPAHNVRVKLQHAQFEADNADGNHSLGLSKNYVEESNDDDTGDIPDRDSLKKFTNQMLQARMKSKQPKKTKKKKSAKKDAEEEGSDA